MNCLKCKKGEDPNDSNNSIDNQIQIDNNCFPIITYTNEKITFDTSDMSSGEIEKSCFDYGKAIIPGKYECIEKPTNYFYVVQDDNVLKSRQIIFMLYKTIIILELLNYVMKLVPLKLKIRIPIVFWSL